MQNVNIENVSKMERLRLEIVAFLFTEEIYGDVTIYCEGKRYRYDYNGKCKVENADVRDYLEYCNPETLSMAFEGTLYDLFNFYRPAKYCNEIIDAFNAIIGKYGLYYEQGSAWNLSLYEV